MIHMNPTFLQNLVSSLQKAFQPDNRLFVRLGILAFLTLSSKHIFIYNEETLILICFIAFIFTCQKMLGESITQSLNERSQLIAQELQNFYNLKEQLVLELIEEHQKQLSIHSFIKKIGQFSLTEVKHVSLQKKKALQSLLKDQIEHKLNTLMSFSNVSNQLQEAISTSFRGAVLEEFYKSKKNFQSVLVKQAVVNLERLANQNKK
uniref:ATP synthase protein MI25 n=1 Tax=Monomastix sp. (strain OKE-1) TaxID=141716 RepID=U5YGJ7_MONSK|nr:ATP synthase F0 subunit beta [Monomastix sp. OKE-1]AGZ90196.1 ATP synthase F0 subunit beta [Monomastix sp. OKE-1]